MIKPVQVKRDLIVHSEVPYNAEPPLVQLRSAFLTAQSDFFVRNHGNIPHITEAGHRLRVDGRIRSPLDLSVAELRDRFPRRSVTAVVQCAGNRRADLQQVRPVLGNLWAGGAIGNAEWTGIALADLLRAADAEDDPTLHVAFAACDEVELPGEDRFHFGASIPMTKAMSPEVLLAFEMNGEKLAPAHGFPLRAVVPGFAGVRSVKWLTGITVQNRPSDNHMQQRDYKLLPPSMTTETVDWAKGVTIYDMPLNAAICEPTPHAALKAGPATLRGYAIATAREIMRVDVSADGGQSWRQAELEHRPDTPWSWTFWQAVLDLPEGEHELAVRAWDSAGQTQPSLPNDVWNFKGYLNAAWHRIPVRVT
jgi:sulfite oxidase